MPNLPRTDKVSQGKGRSKGKGRCKGYGAKTSAMNRRHLERLEIRDVSTNVFALVRSLPYRIVSKKIQEKVKATAERLLRQERESLARRRGANSEPAPLRQVKPTRRKRRPQKRLKVDHQPAGSCEDSTTSAQLRVSNSTDVAGSGTFALPSAPAPAPVLRDAYDATLDQQLAEYFGRAAL